MLQAPAKGRQGCLVEGCRSNQSSMRSRLQAGKLDVGATESRDASGHNTLLLTHTPRDALQAVQSSWLAMACWAGRAVQHRCGVLGYLWGHVLGYLWGHLHRADGQDLGRDGPRAAGEGIAAQHLGALQLAAQSVLSGCSWVALQQLSQGSNIAACLLHPWQTRGWPGAPVAEGLQDRRIGINQPDRAQRGPMSQSRPPRGASHQGASFTEFLHMERHWLPASTGTWTGQQYGVTPQWESTGGPGHAAYGCCLAGCQSSGQIAQAK